MRPSLVSVLALAVFYAAACTSTPTPQAANPDTCPYNTDDQIASALSHDMSGIDAERAAAAACGSASGITAAKDSYASWLDDSANGIEGGVGMPQSFAADAVQAQQQISQLLQACHGAPPQPDCGTDVNCQRGEAIANSFTLTGKNMAFRFQTCNADTREKASRDLSSNHEWN